MSAREKGAGRDLGGGVSVIDDPRVSERTLGLAIRQFGKRVFFEGRKCGGATARGKRLKSGKRAMRCVDGHGPRCKGGKEFWLLLDFKCFANEIIGNGVTPEKALHDAIKRRTDRSIRSLSKAVRP